ncbi:heme-degrading domain-containing protein [Cohnella yongneupensis]|uniref:UPF0303 protein ACFPQ4_01205 n=1 Tax=Cohnella yongneupensis TaxID=425006 RepID=A0ABW0QTH9_9BACL
MSLPNLDKQLAEIVQQEEQLQFSRFTNEMALEIGMLLYAEAKKSGSAVTIDISRNGQCLFHYEMEGTSKDNAEWIRRKNNVVNRFYRSSYYVGTRLRSQGTTMEEKYAISTVEFAAHGGAFPLRMKGAGVIGTITVSGLPQKEDHDLVVRVLRDYLQAH